ncbi:MAG: nicotinate phosphoribosyltransferase [Firmicutes bacterium]|nr:nicotinate phosphoribosyltransferase [Bacillota bacterium]
MSNLSLMTDLYQLTMLNGYYASGKQDDEAVFDLFLRQQVVTSSYAITAGLEQVIDYIRNLKFDKESIAYLKSLKIFDSKFLKYLEGLRFEGDIWAIPEGAVVFAGEPLITVKASLAQAQLIETALLNIINHQTIIATKASRIAWAAHKSPVIEFGLRRAHSPDAGIYGSRAAVIGGVTSTSNVLSAKLFGLRAKGTHAHSWVKSFDTELSAFEAYAEVFKDNCLLLVDTYDTLKSGVPNAIKVFDKLKASGHKPVGIRLDSGDLAYLSKKARAMLDSAGHKDVLIYASGDIDENVIQSLSLQGAKIDAWGVGTRLITGDGVGLNGVYKLAQINGKPKMKVSDSIQRATNPGHKKLYRIYEKKGGKAFADVITLEGEVLDKPLILTHPVERWKTTTLDDYTAKELQVPIFKKGKLVYKSPSVSDIATYSAKCKTTFWDEYFRITNPQIYKVNLSDKLYELKNNMILKETDC